MSVRVGRCFSERYDCYGGVPQWSVLSPLLFLIYTMDLPACLKTASYVNVLVYADDIKIYASYNPDYRHQAQLALRQSVDRMVRWAHQ
ncbi:unnamed protein product [Haemonchus placei]|uniref:Reverse transcriptase domain-containing protein n=1 Tax=Haemonchus placei TaxID=6290 RepID=A0A0N4WVJ5_HAEPC|nr:unnamed protein product [Haemonchus placei]